MTKARDIASAAPAPSTVSATELGYLDGVSSAIQTQIDGKQAVVSGVNNTEIGYLDGVTSAIQTQLDAKVAKSTIDAKGDLLVGTANDTVGRLAVASTAGYLLTVDSAETTGLKWAAPAGGSLPAAKARQTVIQSISNNTWTKVTYTTEDYDTGSDFASSTFTCDTAGYYAINASVGFDSTTVIDYPRIRIYKNGANENETGINKQEYPLLTINTVVYLAVNDTVEIYIYQDSGTSKNTGNGNRSMWFAVTGIRS